MSGTLGTIRGQMILDVKQTLAAYTAARGAHVSTVTALHTGAGALTAIGLGMTAVGVGIGAGLLYAVDAAAKFEKQLDYFGAVSDSTQQEYDDIREKALQLGQDSIYSANEIAESFIELGKSGVSAKGIIDGIGEAVTNLGQATDLPLADAASSLTTILNTFGIEAKDSVGVVDKLAGAANSSSIDVTDLITTMTYAGASAKVAGVKFEDVNTAIAVLGERGIKGSKAGTGLRQMFDKLIAPTKSGTQALTDLGLITEDGTNKLLNMDGSLKPIPDLLDTLSGSLAGMDAAEKMDLLGQIFPITSLPTILNLLDGGSAAMSRLNGEINKTTAMEIAGKRLDNLSGDIEILKGNLETLAIKNGSAFQEFSRGLVQGVTQIVQAFANLPAGVQTGLMVFAAVAAVLFIVIGIFGLFAGAILNMVALAIQLAPVFAALKTAVTVVTGAFKALSLAMIANPIGLIIAGIVLLVAGLVWFFTQTEVGKTAWESFTRFLGEAWANIVSVATTIWTSLVSFFTGLWANLSSFFATWGPLILAVIAPFIGIPLLIATHWTSIVAFFTTLWTNITTGIVAFITGAITFLTALPGQILAFFTGLPAMIGYALGFVLGTIVRIFIEIGTWLLVNVPIIITNVVTFFQELPGKIVQFFTDIYNGAVLWFTNLAVQAIVLAIQIYNGIIQWFQALPGMVIGFFTNLYNGATTWLQNMAVQGIVLAAQLYNGIINWIRQLPTMVTTFFSQVVSNVTTFLGQAVSTAIQMATNIYNGIRDGINGLPGLVTGIMGNIISAIQGAISGAIKAVTSLASGLWEGFKDGLGIHSPSYIEHAMWAITGVIETETERMAKQVRVVQGLGNGISEVGNNLGFGFGDTMNAELISLQAQMQGAQKLQSQFATGSFSAAGVDSTQAVAMASLSDSIDGLNNNAGETRYDIVINNPEPEKASDSLPRTIRKMAYVNG